MGSNKLSIASGVIIERVGEDLMVFTPSSAEALKLTGPIADTVVAIQSGRRVDSSSVIVSDLVAMGIVQSSGMSRRGLITAGALGAGAGVVMLSMPAAAASLSPSNPNSSLLEIVDAYFQTYSGDGEGWYFYVEFAEGNVPTGEVSNLTFTFGGTEYSISPSDPSVLDEFRESFELQWDRPSTTPNFGNDPLVASFTLDGQPYTDVSFRRVSDD